MDEAAFEEACEQDYYRKTEYDQESQDDMDRDEYFPLTINNGASK